MEKLKLRLLHIYPKMLNLYGDFGNILTLKKRMEWRGFELEVLDLDYGGKIVPCDMYFLGGGQDTQQELASVELLKNKDFLNEETENNKVFLGICGGYQLMGEYYQTPEGEQIQGVQMLDIHTISSNKRLIGNVTAKTDFLEPKTLVGFENHGGRTWLGENVKPLGLIEKGFGNNGEDKTEGARYRNVFGTYLHGSLLPKNPHFADYLLAAALFNKYGENELPPLNDNIEFKTHNFLRRYDG